MIKGCVQSYFCYELIFNSAERGETMNLKKGMVLFVVGFVLLYFMSGCVPSRAKIKKTRDVTLQDIVNDKDKYDIYYAGSSSRPIGILVDPKNDGLDLVGDKWMKAEDEGTLSSLLEAVQGFSLNTITDRSDGKLFGYFSKTKFTVSSRPNRTSGYNPLAKIVDENTVNVDLVQWVDSVPAMY
jgi:hypothetical protein